MKSVATLWYAAFSGLLRRLAMTVACIVIARHSFKKIKQHKMTRLIACNRVMYPIILRFSGLLRRLAMTVAYVVIARYEAIQRIEVC